jgi:large subunit ribosomal protein L23
MTPLGIFKKPKKEENHPISQGESPRAPSQEEKMVESEGSSEARKEGKPATKPIGMVLERPHVSEKSALLAGLNQYVFVIKKSATKSEVKKAIEDFYGVKVEKTRIINIPGKVKRLGRSEGWRPGYKKAIVTLKKGEKIELG